MTFEHSDFITDEQRDDGEAGVTLSDLSRALTTIVGMRSDPLTVFDAMQIFGASEAVIRAAVEDGYWLLALGDSIDSSQVVIEADGE